MSRCSSVRVVLTEGVTAWVLSAYGDDARLVAKRPVYSWRPGAPVLVQVKDSDGSHEAIVRTATLGRGRNPIAARMAAALTAAETFDVPAPRLIAADIDGSRAGDPAILESVLPGTSEIPRVATTARLQAFGQIIGRLWYAEMSPTNDLNSREASIDVKNGSAERRRAVRFERSTAAERTAMIQQLSATWECNVEEAEQRIVAPASGRSDLLEAAEERLAMAPVPSGRTTLVHGDLWQGNLLWVGDEPCGLIDWDVAGVGHPYLDLGTARLDAAIMFGVDAMDEVLAGWQRATDHSPVPNELAYWDIRAALNTPATMEIPAVAEYGRADLDAATQAARRDDFLRAALHRLA